MRSAWSPSSAPPSGIGNAVGPVGPAATAPRHRHTRRSGHGAPDGHDPAASPAASGAHVPGGLLVSEHGYTLDLADSLPAGQPPRCRSGSSARTARPVTALRRAHDKELHLIVVRRDLTGFQHLHPSWPPTAPGRPADRAAAGPYRVFADFTPTGHDGAHPRRRRRRRRRLRPRPLPAPSAHRHSRRVHRHARPATSSPGQASQLTLTVSRDGQPVTDLQPYLARLRPPGRAARRRPGLPARAPRRRTRRRAHRGRPGHHLLRRGALAPATTGCSWTSSTAAWCTPPSSPPSPVPVGPRQPAGARSRRPRPPRHRPWPLIGSRRWHRRTAAPTAPNQIELAIGGMTCASCAARIEKKLNRLDGVTATVNYATEKADGHRTPTASRPTT